MIVWITGLSASGKTTIGRALYKMWKDQAVNTVLVDGDEVRAILKNNKGNDPYTLKGRRAVADYIAELCYWLDTQDINVVCCTISSFEELRRHNRERLSKYFEVYLSVSMETVYRRDVKQLYQPALNGERQNVVGVDIPFTPPESPDMLIENSHDLDNLEPLAAQILKKALNS